MTREDKVAQFVTAASKVKHRDMVGQKYDASVIDCIEEEMHEFEEAFYDYIEDPNPQTREHLCKELADLQYVVSQAAWYFDIPMDVAFNRVHDNNMTKIVGGRIIRQKNGKILKPDSYKPADLGGL